MWAIRCIAGNRSVQLGQKNDYDDARIGRQGEITGRTYGVFIGNRVETAVATRLWGPPSLGNIPEDVLSVSDFSPRSLGAYEQFQPAGKKMELRKNHCMSIEKFPKAGQRRTLIFSLFYGKENATKRNDCIAELVRIRESRPDIPPVALMFDTFGSMDFR